MEKLNENKKWIAVIELIAAILLAIVLYPIGFVYSIVIQPFIYHNRKFKVYRYVINFFYQIWFVLMYLFHSIAFTLDVLGNVIVGELIEIIITNKEFLKDNSDTWFGLREHSISQAIGYIEKREALNNTGVKLSNLLSKIFGKNHCKNAYEFYIRNNN